MNRGVLLDTNVVSELGKGRHATPQLLKWLAATDESRLYLSVVTLGDIERGIALAEAEGRSMAAQRRFLSGDIPDRFGPRILQFGSDAALIWGRLLAELKRDQEQVRRLAIRRSDRRNSGGRAALRGDEEHQGLRASRLCSSRESVRAEHIVDSGNNLVDHGLVSAGQPWTRERNA